MSHDRDISPPTQNQHRRTDTVLVAPTHSQIFAGKFQTQTNVDTAHHMAFIVVGWEGKTLSYSGLIGPEATRQPELL
ncbi:MAG: hypothetical protein OXC83_05950 [Chloroflexi bacterium]|nr:hypothetical protein [Chloroflexota bacterium]